MMAGLVGGGTCLACVESRGGNLQGSSSSNLVPNVYRGAVFIGRELVLHGTLHVELDVRFLRRPQGVA
jgi:hypothetical protein